MSDRPALQNWPHWFDPRNKSLGSFAFILNRITALGLTFYLILHLIALGQLAQGAEAYDNFIALVRNPIYKIGELLVIAAGVFHGLNGIRIALNSFGIGVRQQRAMFLSLTALSIAITIFFGYKMFMEG